MKHASHRTLAALHPLLVELRTIGALVERSPGIFYVKGRAFLHFHEDDDGVFADVKLDGVKFERRRVASPDERMALVLAVRASMARAVAALPAESPGLDELQATVQRMEAHLSALPGAPVAALMVAYRRLCARFEHDLRASPRDVALAKASALMLVQAAVRSD